MCEEFKSKQTCKKYRVMHVELIFITLVV